MARAFLQRQRKTGTGGGGNPQLPGPAAKSKIGNAPSQFPSSAGHDFGRISLLGSPTVVNVPFSDLLRAAGPISQPQPNLKLPPIKAYDQSNGVELFHNKAFSLSLLTSFPDPDIDESPVVDPVAQTAAVKKSILKEIMVTGTPPAPLDLLRPSDFAQALWPAILEKLSPDTGKQFIRAGKKAGSRLELGIIPDVKPALAPVLSGKQPDFSKAGGGLKVTLHF